MGVEKREWQWLYILDIGQVNGLIDELHKMGKNGREESFLSIPFG